MARRERRRAGEHREDNAERWLLPYADMITLLLALFIMLYASSSTNKVKLDALTKSVTKAFNGQQPAPQTSTGRPSALNKATAKSLLNSGLTIAQIRQTLEISQQRKAEDQRLRSIQKRIERTARRQGLSRSLSTELNERGLVVRLITDKILFDPGRANLRSEIHPLLNSMARIIRRLDNHIRVEGHTDSVPIHTAQFATNWELSSIRASSVVRYLIRQGVAGSKLSASGYAHRHPISTNRSAEGRQRNRRVEIVILREGPNLSGG